jgi:16S rRNA (guanine527-N7)-methyltransferase
VIPADVEARHRALLEKWRGAVNLVGPGPIDVHFADSARAVEGLEARGRWADLGSGAGFPGVALAAAWPEARVLLVESRDKRVQFLKTLRAELALPNLEVFHGRSEALEPGFDGVISRAMGPPPIVFAEAGRLLVPGGRVVFLLSDAQALDPPRGWTSTEERGYLVEDRSRRRLVFSKQA